MTADRLTLAQIATGSLAAARVLERRGLDYCRLSECSLADACAAQGVDLATVEKEVAAAQDDPRDDRDWTTEPLQDLMAFLCAEHVVIQDELHALQRRLETVVAAHDSLYPGLDQLPVIFAGLCEELRVHMGHEEADVFPAIQRHLENSQRGEPFKSSPLSAFGGPLRMMETEHESAGAALRLMREFAQDYDVPAESCPVYRMLVRGMSAIEDRILRHMYLENNILFPRAAALKPRRVSTHV